MEGLTEEERRALRVSKFAPLPSAPAPSRPNPRLAHPGGPLTTNKAAALAKFLERKLQDPNGLDSLKPELLELAVKNAKATVNASGTSRSGRVIRHVDSFGDSEMEALEDEGEKIETKKQKKKKKKKNAMGKNKKHKPLKDPGDTVLKKPKTKLKL
ncbi:hypothetical protein RHGRI_003276 [Rhododendron griersonianum]|uniref:Uncharacterized protein n=1 Tax=Rhododendron griersonianum TaxID=479676 RepID=A0AAV6L6Z2_9ERIC|nr:hypothetical protein RHGRI_003276 [Rhododendron griersonianum]